MDRPRQAFPTFRMAPMICPLPAWLLLTRPPYLWLGDPVSYRHTTGFTARVCVQISNVSILFIKNANEFLSGDGDHNDTFYLNLETKQWTRGPDLRQGRAYLTCSLITKPSPKIVIVGGSYMDSSSFSKSRFTSNHVDIIDLTYPNIIISGK